MPEPQEYGCPQCSEEDKRKGRQRPAGRPCDICAGRGYDYIGRACRHCSGSDKPRRVVVCHPDRVREIQSAVAKEWDDVLVKASPLPDHPYEQAYVFDPSFGERVEFYPPHSGEDQA